MYPGTNNATIIPETWNTGVYFLWFHHIISYEEVGLLEEVGVNIDSEDFHIVGCSTSPNRWCAAVCFFF